MTKRVWAAVAFVALASAAPAQTHWEHTRLLAEAPPPPLIGVGSGAGAAINPSGIAVYMSGGGVYKGTELYGTGNSIRGINDAGQFAWTSAGHVFVDHQDISAGIVHDGDRHDVSLFGISGDGRPFWEIEWAAPATNEFELYVGTESLNVGAILGAHRMLGAVSDHILINRQGTPLFVGWGDATRQVVKVIEGKLDVTTPVLGAGGRGWMASAINDAGQVAWSGSKAGSPDHSHAFVDAVDVTTAVLGDAADGVSADLNNRGQLLWTGVTKYGNHVFVDGVDLTAKAYGAMSAYASPMMLSGAGNALWSGALEGDYLDVFSDDRNLSKSLLGGHRYETPVGIADGGGVLWDGMGDNIVGNHVFVDQFDLSADALGQHGWDSYAIAVGPRGHCLWMARDPTTNLYDFYLSTPVPEPAALAGLVVAAASVVLTRRRREKGVRSGPS